jgi:hypothetical protein
MKKILLGFAVIVAIASCSNTKIDESESTGVTPGTAGVEKLETLSNADTAATDTTEKK